MTCSLESTKIIGFDNETKDYSNTCMDKTKEKSIDSIVPTSKEEIQEFLKEINMTDCEKTGWSLVCHKEECDVWAMKSNESSTLKIKVDGSASFKDIPLDVLIDVITNPLHMDKWDKNMLEFKTVCNVDDCTRVNYYSITMPIPLKGRDWVLRQSVIFPKIGTPSNTNEYIIFNKSCICPDQPERPEFVRANCILNGWHISPSSDGKGCLVHYYAHNEFLGSIPTIIVNWATKVLASTIVTRLREACDTVMNEKKLKSNE